MEYNRKQCIQHIIGKLFPYFFDRSLDKILNGSIDNKSTFDKHLQKVLAVLNISVDDLVFFEAKPKSDIVDVVYSENAPKDYKISDKAQKQYGLLMDILELCDIYY